MTVFNKTTLQTFFETGDVPNGQNYADFIDSCVNMAETTVQTVQGPLNPTELITPKVSAGNGVFTGNLSVAGTLSAATLSFDSISASAGTFVGRVSANSLSSTIGVFGNVAIISAAGTTQATAAQLSAVINRGAGVVDGTTTGFVLINNRAGLTQYVVNGGASANLYPPSECVINVLATNAAFGMTANTLYTIIHTTNSAFAVK
jgi:hypothetical protein